MQVTSYTSGYVVDRLVGSTDGLLPFDGILATIGEGPSRFTYLPVATVLKQFFSRSVKVLSFTMNLSSFGTYNLLNSQLNRILKLRHFLKLYLCR